MGMEFTTVLAAARSPLGEVSFALRARMTAAGFAHDGSLVRAELDAQRQVFDELDPEQEARLSEGVDADRLLAGWGGFAAEFWSEGMVLYVLVGHAPANGFMNIWVDVSLAQLAASWEQDGARRYFGALASVARSCNAVGGFGHGLLAFEARAPAAAIDAILSLPEYPGEPASLGLVRADELERLRTDKAVAERYEATFDSTLSSTGYWVLVNKDFGSMWGTAG